MRSARADFLTYAERFLRNCLWDHDVFVYWHPQRDCLHVAVTLRDDRTWHKMDVELCSVQTVLRPLLQDFIKEVYASEDRAQIEVGPSNIELGQD